MENIFVSKTFVEQSGHNNPSLSDWRHLAPLFQYPVMVEDENYLRNESLKIFTTQYHMVGHLPSKYRI